MPDNTLREEVQEILKTTADVEKVIRLSLAAIKNRLPKERVGVDLMGTLGAGEAEAKEAVRTNVEVYGYNTCLAEVYKALDIESES